MSDDELRCRRDLAERLGAVSPVTIAHHRALSEAGHLLVRDYETGWPMFWPWIPETIAITDRSTA